MWLHGTRTNTQFVRHNTYIFTLVIFYNTTNHEV